MIATGTGIAPMISFLEEKMYNKSTNFEEMKLIFGIRNKDHDFICQEFLQFCLDQKILKELILVQSRVDNKYV